MKKLHIFSLVVFCIAFIALFFIFSRQKSRLVSPVGKTKSGIKEKPLEKYTFENLRNTTFEAREIKIGKLLKEGEGFNSYIFYYYVSGKKISGLINLPGKEGIYPVIIMFRGYVDREIYTTGEGTRRSAEAIATNGFITLSPDFLGYGESDKPSDNSIEERFQTYTTALTLLGSVKNLNEGLNSQCHAEFISASPSSKIEIPKPFGLAQGEQVRDDNNKIQNDNLCNIQADTEKIGIWGHSNGGHITLSVLAISGKNYPAVLWNPVSKPFPYSILYFTDEFEDNGKALRYVIANFEKDYDIEKYSPPNYYKWINAPIQLHQAIEDEAVPERWSDQLNEKLTGLEKDITYFTYPGENHNFNSGSWGAAIQRSINFYNTEFQKQPENPWVLYLSHLPGVLGEKRRIYFNYFIIIRLWAAAAVCIIC